MIFVGFYLFTETAIVALSKALSRFESTAHPNMFGTGPERDLFESVAPYVRAPWHSVDALTGCNERGLIQFS